MSGGLIHLEQQARFSCERMCSPNGGPDVCPFQRPRQSIQARRCSLMQIDSTGDDVDGGGAAGAIDWDVSVGEEGQEGTSEQDPARPTPCAASPEDATVDGTSAVSLAVHALIAGGEARTRCA